MTLKFTYFDTQDYLEGLLDMNDKELWASGICLDDWDYGVVIEGHIKTMSAYLMEHRYQVYRLLNGCSSNEWFEVKAKNGKLYTIGMAYHS